MLVLQPFEQLQGLLLKRHHLVLVSPTRLHVCQHSRAKERLIVPKERLDEKRAECEREKKEERAG